MKQLLEQLAEWQDNIGCDIRNDASLFEASKQQSTLQFMILSQAIGLLQFIGNNNNIPE